MRGLLVSDEKVRPLRFPAPIAVPLIAAGVACAAGQGHAATLNLAINHSLRLPVAGRAASVVVGNAAVADVTVVDSRTLYVTGKAAGSTDVAVVDPLGRTVYAADIAVSAGSGSPVTVHRASVTTEIMCDPRCVAGSAAEPKPTGMAALVQDIAGLGAAKPPQITPTVTTQIVAGNPLAALSAVPAGPTAPR